MRRRALLARTAAAATGLAAGCVRGPGDVEVGTVAPDQVRRNPLDDCDLPGDGSTTTADGATETIHSASVTPRLADSASLGARLLREVRRNVPVVRSTAPGFADLVLFQRLFALADEASPADRGTTVRTDSVPIESPVARRAIAAKECLPVPTYVVHGEWVLSVALYREAERSEASERASGE